MLEEVEIIQSSTNHSLRLLIILQILQLLTSCGLLITFVALTISIQPFLKTAVSSMSNITIDIDYMTILLKELNTIMHRILSTLIPL